MCWVFSCAGWILDLIQKCITFLLTCVAMVVIGAFIAFGAILGIAYGYNVSLAEHYSQKPTDPPQMMIGSLDQDNGAFLDLTRKGGRKQGLEDDIPIVGDEKIQLNDKADNFKNIDEHVPCTKLTWKIETDEPVKNRPLVPQVGDTYASWWNNVENQLLFPKSSSTPSGDRTFTESDIINLMPSLITGYKPEMSTTTVSKSITEKLKSLLRGSSGDLRKPTDYGDHLPKGDKIPETVSGKKTTDRAVKSSKLIYRKTKPKVGSAKAATILALATAPVTVGIRKTVDSREDYEYNELRAVPTPTSAPARAFPIQSRRTWKDLFKSSTRKTTKLSENEKSDDEDFYKERNTEDIRKTVNKNKLRFQKTTDSSAEDVSFRFVIKGPEINVVKSEEEDSNSEESYEY